MDGARASWRFGLVLQPGFGLMGLAGVLETLQAANRLLEQPLYDTAWNFAWQVNAALNTVTDITVDSTVEDPLAVWGNALLECVIKRLKPAQTTVLFSYT